MKSKIFIFLIFFIVFVSSCAKFKNEAAYVYIPELYHNSAQTAYDNGNIAAALNLAEQNCKNLDYESNKGNGSLLDGLFIQLNPSLIPQNYFHQF